MIAITLLLHAAAFIAAFIYTLNIPDVAPQRKHRRR